VDGRRRPRDRRCRRAAARDADGARSHGKVPARRGRARGHPPRRDHLLDRAAARLPRGARRLRVGVDLIEIARIRRALERYPSFRERCFTEAEREYCESRPNPAESYAGRFAGKEAVGKALGFGVARAFAWREIEIVGRPKPRVRLSGRVERWAARVEAGAIDLSMTHSRELAAAIAAVEDAVA
jgi:holo-[acyl-carrier protein] synthase